MSQKKIAVVLMNLGGPDSLAAVQPFLYNLFADKAIISLPSPFRQLLASFISRTRNKKAQGIYQKMGGKSPLLENTVAQATALERQLQIQVTDKQVKVFIAMRYWHPLTPQTVTDVLAFAPDQIILVPLYPHFSTTTTASSLREWYKYWPENYPVGTQEICCYSTEQKFLKAYQGLIVAALTKVPTGQSVRVLFSAHGLPQKIVDAGDPYQYQVEQSVSILVKDCEISDYQVCYQSRVGPLKWLQPNLEDEIIRAANDGVGVIIVPISFVSEHAETLVELDMDYRDKARELHLPYYDRVATVSCNEFYIASLAHLVNNKINQIETYPFCPPEFKNCWCRQ